MAKEQNYTQFAAEHGYVTDYDVLGHIHAGLMAAHMPKSYHLRYQQQLEVLQELRAAGKKAYEAAIAAGDVSRPRELTRIEQLTITAAGDPDFPSTQAAKRTLARIAAATVSECLEKTT